jgi:hypothetical protein
MRRAREELSMAPARKDTIVNQSTQFPRPRMWTTRFKEPAKSVLAAVVVVAACDATPTEAPVTFEPAAAEAMAPLPLETADIMNQGGMGVYAADGARVVRQTDGLRVSVRMPTPEPGTYVYPAGIEAGHPEVFTLWVFIFNYPQLCTGTCDGDDIGAGAAAKGSVYGIAGHVASGGWLQLTGRAGIGEPAGAPPGIEPTPLVNPMGAEIHLAVTSHGALDPATLPEEFHIPTGSPVCGCWWTADF